MLFSSVLAFLAAPFMFKPAEVTPSVPDPNWKTAAAPIDKLIGWLETKDPNETYNWWCAKDCAKDDACLLKQFGRAMGYERPYMDAIRLFSVQSSFNSEGFLEPGAIAYGWHSRPGGERTFGAALQRARAYKAKH